jgi:hypothetical protein
LITTHLGLLGDCGRIYVNDLDDEVSVGAGRLGKDVREGSSLNEYRFGQYGCLIREDIRTSLDEPLVLDKPRSPAWM